MTRVSKGTVPEMFVMYFLMIEIIWLLLIVSSVLLIFLEDWVVLWLGRWTPDWEVRIWVLAGSLCFVLEQDTLLWQCLSPPRSRKGYRWIVRETWWNAGERGRVPCKGLASCLGEVAVLSVASCCGDRGKLRRCGPFGSCADFFLSLYWYSWVQMN